MDEPSTIEKAFGEVCDTSHGAISINDVHYNRRGA